MTATTDARRDGRGSTLPRPSASRARYGSPTGLIVKIVLLGFVNAVGIWGISVMIAEPDWALAISAMVALALIDVVYLSKRFIPAKYLLPGTLFLVAFVLYPVIYTIYISTTNYGTGNNLSREQAITQIERRSIRPADESIRYELQILAEDGPAGQLAYLLTDPDGNYFLGTAEGVEPLSADDIVADGRRETVEGYVALNTGQAQDRVADVREFVVPSPAGDIVNDGFGAALARLQGLRYDAASGTIVDTVDGTVYVEEGGYFVAEDGSQLLPGWRSSVGLDNYQRLFENDQIRSNFTRVFVWTFLFALCTVALQFGLGLFLAIVFHNARMRGRRYYRSLLIIPYAIPSFMTALVWQGMMNQRFGVLNRWLGTDFGWLDSQWLPYFSILLVSMWLGWPYMFLVCTGALQSIPDDLTEAAKVDGASGPMRFRRITFPLLLVAVSPLLIASFAFNFNNFNLIYLLTEGRPPVAGSVAGRTDILISYTYKLAFAGGRGADYGFAAAVSFIIFILTAVISAIGFHFTRTYEEIR